MEYVIACTKEEKEIMQIALYGYLNRYRERLKEIDDMEYKMAIEERIKTTERLLQEMGN